MPRGPAAYRLGVRAPSFAVLYLLIFCRSTRQHFHFWCREGNGFRPPNFLFAAPKKNRVCGFQ
jgi:hypothetical protein